MKSKYFRLAKSVAKLSSHTVHQIGGILVKKGKILSTGANQTRTHSLSNHPFKSIHCELSCILGVSREKLVGSTLYLYRERRDGIPSLSKPCMWCRLLLKTYGIKKVCYTDNGGYTEQLVKDL